LKRVIEGDIDFHGRICILRHAYFPADPRVNTHVETLIASGYDVDIICLRNKNQPAKEHHGPLTIYRAPVRHKRQNVLRYAIEYGAFAFLAAFLLSMLNLRRRYDVVQVYNMPDFLLFAALPAKVRGTRLLWYMLELTPDLAANAMDLSKRHPFIRALLFIERLCLKTADQIVCVSDYQRDVIQRRSLPPGKSVTVILNVPEATLFKPGVAHVNGNGGFRLFTHGSILKRYRIDTAIRALPILTRKIQGLEFMILGQGEHRPELEHLARTLGVENHVRFLEPVPHDSVPPYIERADVCLLLTGVPWLSPNKVFEYAAMKRPIIAARSAFLETIFENGDIFTFEQGDVEAFASAVLHLYNDRRAGLEQAARAHETFLRHRWELEKDIYLRIQKNLLAN